MAAFTGYCLIRAGRLTDFIEMRRAPFARIILYNEMTLAGGHRPLWFALRGATPFASDWHTMVYRDRGLRGFLQGQCRPGSTEVDLLYFAVQPFRRGDRQPTDPDVWYRLLHEYIARMGDRGIERFFAPLATTSPNLEVFRQLGFQTYTTRQIWRALTPEVAEGSAMIALRPQRRRDPHAIQRLYETITPSPVQRAEGRTSRSWQLPVMGSRVGLRQRSWVLGRDGRDDQLRAALHLWLGNHAAVLSLLIDPTERDLASAVLRFGLTQVASAHHGQVYVLLPAYHGDLGHALGEIGFECLGEQWLQVKTTTAMVRKPLLRPALESSLETITQPSVTSAVRISADALRYERSGSSGEQ